MAEEGKQDFKLVLAQKVCSLLASHKHGSACKAITLSEWAYVLLAEILMHEPGPYRR